MVAGDAEAALNRSAQHVRGENEECHDDDRHEAGQAFVERESRVGVGCRIWCRAARDGTGPQHVDEHSEQHRESEVHYHGIAVLEALAAVKRNIHQNVAKGRIGAGREQDALDDQCVPDPERPLPCAPPHRASEQDKRRDEWRDTDRIAQLGEVVRAQIAREPEGAVTSYQERHEK